MSIKTSSGCFNVCYITNFDYLNQTYTSMNSLKINKHHNIKYDVYLFCVQVDDMFLNKIKLLNSHDFNIHPIFIKQNIFTLNDNAGTVFYKLLLHELLTECDIIFHIDSDTIIVDDISEIFDIDINDYYIAGVKDKIHYNGYINAGNILMNLKKMREYNGLYSQYMELNSKNDYDLFEQSIMNDMFKGKIKYIHYKFNFLLNHYGKYYSTKSMAMIYGEIPTYKTIKILHFAGKYKPWKSKTLLSIIYNNYKNNNIDKNMERKILKLLYHG